MPKTFAAGKPINFTHFILKEMGQRYSLAMKQFPLFFLLITTLISCGKGPEAQLITAPKIANGEKLEVSHKLEKSIVTILDKYRNNEFRCTGSILTKNSILTAAHCLTNISLPIFINGKKYTIDKNIVYPTYGKNYSYLDDIAIIKLKEEINSQDFHPVTLYRGEVIPEKAKLVGRSTFITSPYPDHATAILKILVRHHKYVLAKDLSDYIKEIPSLKSSLKNSENVSFTLTTYRSQSLNKKNAPALFYNNLKGGPLPGDSGSPLFMEDKNGNFLQIGVTQYVMMNHQYPMIYDYHVHDSTGYANVSYYLKWIKEMAQEYDLGEIKTANSQEKKPSLCDEARAEVNEVFIEKLGIDLVKNVLDNKCPKSWEQQHLLTQEKIKQCQKLCGAKDPTCEFAKDSLPTYNSTYKMLCAL